MKTFNKIFCIIKTTLYEKWKSDTSVSNPSKLDLQKQKLLKISYLEHKQFLENFKKWASNNNINIHFINAEQIQSIKPSSKDLVISCGGDGTFYLVLRITRIQYY